MQFLHRIVLDFLQTKDVDLMISESLDSEFNPKKYLCNATFAQLKALDFNRLQGEHQHPLDLLEDIIFYAHALEQESHVPQITLLNEVDDFFSEGLPSSWWKKDHRLGYLEFVLQRRLYLYMAYKLMHLSPSDKNELLYLALIPKCDAHYDLYFAVETVDLLLQHGASINSSSGNATVWGEFLYCMVEQMGCDWPEERKPALLAVTRLLLLHGADPNHRIIIKERTEATDKASPPLIRGVNSFFGPYGTPKATVQTRSVYDVLKGFFGSEEASELMENAPPPQKTTISKIRMCCCCWRNIASARIESSHFR